MAITERNGNYKIDVRVQGKRIRRVIGPDQELAELVVKDLEVKAAKGEYLGIVEERQIAFKGFCGDYLKWARANKTLSTVARDESTINKHLIPWFGATNLPRITPKQIEDYKGHRVAKAKPRTVNRELDTLRSMFSRAVEWGWIKQHPCTAVKRLKYQKQPPAYLNRTQLATLLEHCDTPLLRAFVALGGHAGLRRGEILQLCWDDVDLRTAKLTIRHTKNNEFRMVPMNEVVQTALRRHPRHITSPLVLARPDGEGYKDVRFPFEGALKRAELPRIRIHDLRHSFGSNLVAAGVPLPVVSELMGHKDISTTMIYAHLTPAQKQDAVDLLVQGGQYLDTLAFRAQKKSPA
jgi:integrase